MKEIDDTIPLKPDLERPITQKEWMSMIEYMTNTLSKNERKHTFALEKWIPRILMLEERIRELESEVEDLHATDSARRVNLTTEDPEWY